MHCQSFYDVPFFSSPGHFAAKRNSISRRWLIIFLPFLKIENVGMQRIGDILYFVRTIYRYLRLVIFLFTKSYISTLFLFWFHFSFTERYVVIRTVSEKSRFIEGKKRSKISDRRNAICFYCSAINRDFVLKLVLR